MEASAKYNYRGMNIKREHYCYAVVLLAAQDLKDKGLLAGGPKVDIKALESIRAIGEELCFEKPTEEETFLIINQFR